MTLYKKNKIYFIIYGLELFYFDMYSILNEYSAISVYVLFDMKVTVLYLFASITDS